MHPPLRAKTRSQAGKFVRIESQCIHPCGLRTKTRSPAGKFCQAKIEPPKPKPIQPASASSCNSGMPSTGVLASVSQNSIILENMMLFFPKQFTVGVLNAVLSVAALAGMLCPPPWLLCPHPWSCLPACLPSGLV